MQWIRRQVADPYFVAAFFLSFLLVFIKKWEIGGHIDTIWYSTMAKNIHLSGDFFKFGINEYFHSDYYDHFPMTYWVVAAVFNLFGVSTFTAKIYTLVCSFISFLTIFKIGEKIISVRFGLLCILAWAFCFGGTKYTGTIRMDVPLTTYYLLAFYFYLRGLERPIYFYAVSIFIAFGVFTKGPIIGGFGLGLAIWTIVTRKIGYLKQPHFWFAIVFMLLLLAIPFLPALHFKGQDFYSFYYNVKKSYLQEASGAYDYFFYFLSIPKHNPITTILFFCSLPFLFKRNRYFSVDVRQKILLSLCIALSIVIPLSIFRVKFLYYLLPFYPFFAIVAAMAPFVFVEKKGWDFAVWIKRVSIAGIMFFVAFPVKTSGKRPKTLINMVNQIKVDEAIESKGVHFVGDYYTDMAIFQTFKFYGNISLRPSALEEVKNTDLHHAYVILRHKDLPIQIRGENYKSDDCLFYNKAYCVLTDRKELRFRLPDDKMPYEIY